MAEPTFRDRLKAANAPLTDPDKNRAIGAGPAKFELYHFALSVCSQKVRTCLAEKAASNIGHDINIQPGNYHPDYIRLRLLGRAGLPLVGAYTGRSSTETEGFDPAVVPTLVDLDAEEVLVDSVRICNHLNRVCPGGPELVPDRLKAEIEREIAVVDGTPHVTILYGAYPDGDFRPEKLRRTMPGIHDRKLAKLNAARLQVANDPELAEAFDAKIAKEAAGKSFVATPDMMRDAVREIVAIVAALNRRLGDGRTWVCGDDFTMADIHWAVSLFRLKWIGMEFCWQGGHGLNDLVQPQVAAYARRLFARPSFRDAVIEWPGVPQSEYVAEFYQDS